MENNNLEKKYKTMLTVVLLGILVALGIIGYLIKSNYDLKGIISKITPSQNCNLCTDYTGTGVTELEIAMLNNMANNFKTTPISNGRNWNRQSNPMVADSTGHPMMDSRSIWFSIDSLKKFIWEIENTVCKNNCGNPIQNLNLGIRLYYARYPISNIHNGPYKQLYNLKKGYENLHTIFMIPTYDKKGINTDFDPRRYLEDCKYDTLPNGDSHYKALVFMPIANETAKNHGDLCPPVCEGTSF